MGEGDAGTAQSSHNGKTLWWKRWWDPVPSAQVPYRASTLLAGRHLDPVGQFREGSGGIFSAPWPGHAQRVEAVLFQQELSQAVEQLGVPVHTLPRGPAAPRQAVK